MTDIAQLGYEIDSSGLVEATRQLDRNAEAAERTSGSAQILEREYQNLSRAASETSSAVAGNEARYRGIAQRAMEWAEATRTANVSERALAEAAREAALGIDTKAQVMARAGTEQERMVARARALQQAEERASQKTLAAARATQVRELNLKRLLGQIDPTVAALDRLADQEARLEQARDLGLIKPQVFEQYQQKLDMTRAATLNAGKASDVMTQSLGKLNLQSIEVQQSMAALGRSLVTGQWGQAQASITSLTARTGMMSAAFSSTGLIIGGMVAGIGALGAAAHSAERDVSNITNALLVTGNYADVTVGKIDGLVDSLASLEAVSHGGARAALLAVAQTGRFTGEQFEMVATIAARMEASVGQSLDTTIQKFREIERDPVDALLKLNETEHFLTQAHLDRIDALIAEGDEQGAAAEAARIYATRLDDIATSAENARPHLAQMTSEIKEMASAAWEGTKNFTEFLAATAQVTNQRPAWQRFGFMGMFNFLRDMGDAEPVMPGAVAPVAGAVDSRAESKRRSAAEAAERDIQRQIESLYGLDTAVNKLERSFLSLSEARQKELIASGEYNRLLQQAMKVDAEKLDRKNRGAARSAEALANRLQRATNSMDRSMREWQTILDGTGSKVMDDFAKRMDAIRTQVAEFERLKVPTGQIRAFEEEMTRLAAAIRDKDVAEYLRDFNHATAEMTAFMTPGAAAALRYEKAVEELNEEMRAGILTAEAYANRLDALAVQRDRPALSLLAAMEDELYLLRMSNHDQEIWNNLKMAGVSAESELGRAIIETTRELQQQREEMERQVEAMDAVRSAGSNFLSDLMKGENPLSALESALDRIHKKFSDMIAEQLMDQLLGTRGSTGGGAAGDWLSGILGALFGGTGRAWGGDVRGDRMYRVGEFNRPEILNFGRGQQYLIPGDHGRVEPIASAQPPGGSTVNQKIYVQGTTDSRTARQIAIRSAQRQRLASARFGG